MKATYITLYSTNCPKCRVLISKLDNSQIMYSVCEDVAVMTDKGFTTVPSLDVDGEVLDFKQAVDWINERATK